MSDFLSLNAARDAFFKAGLAALDLEDAIASGAIISVTSASPFAELDEIRTVEQRSMRLFIAAETSRRKLAFKPTEPDRWISEDAAFALLPSAARGGYAGAGLDELVSEGKIKSMTTVEAGKADRLEYERNSILAYLHAKKGSKN